MDFELVGAADAEAVGEDRAVGGEVDHGDGGVLVGAEGVGVDEALVGTVEAVADVEGGLVFLGEALAEEVVVAAAGGDADEVDAQEGGHLLADLGEGFECWSRYCWV